MRKAFSYRADTSVPEFPDDRPILIFDGNCVLCSGFVDFLLRRDKQKLFRFLSAQSPLGSALYQHYGLVSEDYDSNILLENGIVRIKSDGSLRVLELLGFPWSMAFVARIFPYPLRDWLYDLIARNRLKWFGVRASCYLPDQSDADRFLG
ncbi:DCC1-like thiol-disulfide oxidoreductase family protein [Phyllobacterium sp. SB3]|uniref:thiol-disulfide oxidoreductase DCC family protein n=1 Tax=Phyllobacterium sp. SB3 TaxID=3156073 RepID=UPI0032AF330B